jgi:hypothetical protein
MGNKIVVVNNGGSGKMARAVEEWYGWTLFEYLDYGGGYARLHVMKLHQALCLDVYVNARVIGEIWAVWTIPVLISWFEYCTVVALMLTLGMAGWRSMGLFYIFLCNFLWIYSYFKIKSKNDVEDGMSKGFAKKRIIYLLLSLNLYRLSQNTLVWVA